MIQNSQKKRTRTLVFLIIVALPLLIQTVPGRAVQEIVANCRYGVGIVPSDPATEWIAPLGAGWYMDFSVWANGAVPTNDAEYVYQLRVRQDQQNGVRLPTYTFTPTLTDAGLGALLDADPGKLWLVGNEVDVDNFVQDNTFPDVYAHAYYEAYHYIKQRDPSAQVGIAPLSMMTPGRLQYLDIVWNTYQHDYGEPMPVDVWTTHLYILSEIRPWDGEDSDGKIAFGTDPALAKKAYWSILGPPETECLKDDVYCRAEHDSLSIFIEQITALRQWMKAHGQQNKPLILSEYSQLYPFVDYDDPINPTECFLMDELGQCFTAPRVNNFMEATFDYLETAQDPALGNPYDNNRLVQQWLWYSLVTHPEATGGSSNLLKTDYANYAPGSLDALTLVGSNYRVEVLSRTAYVNLHAGDVPPVIGEIIPPATTTDVDLTAVFTNNGNTSITQPFQVTFYANAALTQVIGSVEITPMINGCARPSYTASTTWNNLSPGVHKYWIKVDSGNDIAGESDESFNDNVARGIVLIDPIELHLPVIMNPN